MCKKAIATIDDADYLAALQKLAKAKLANLKSEKNIFVKKTKLRNYLMEKGFEGNLIMEVVNGM